MNAQALLDAARVDADVLAPRPDYVAVLVVAQGLAGGSSD